MHKKRILIVEDDRAIMEILQTLLEAENYSVECAANGEMALELLKATSELPNLILLDQMMPVMDGIQFCEEQRRDSRLENIPLVMMTADRRMGQEPQAGHQTYLGKPFLRKPFDADDLLGLVERLCS